MRTLYHATPNPLCPRHSSTGRPTATLHLVHLVGYDPHCAELNLCVTLGGAFNVSLLATILEQRHYIRQALLAQTHTLSPVGTQHVLRTRETLAAQIGGDLPPATHAKVLLNGLIDRETLLLAFNNTFFGYFAVISLCGLVLVLFFRRAWPTRPG